MATATKNSKTTMSAADKKKARSEAAKKAAETRRLNKLAKEQAKKQKEAELEQEQVKEVLAEQPVKICDVICDVLQQVRPGTEKNARPEGYTYKECLVMVLDRVRPTNPDAATSLDCLRWYATKLRGEGVVLPYRPRNAPTKKAQVDPTA